MGLFERAIKLGSLRAREADLERRVRVSSTTWLPGAEYGWPDSRPGLLGHLGGVREEIREVRDESPFFGMDRPKFF